MPTEELSGPVLSVTIEIPTQENGAVFAAATEWRLARAVRAFRQAFEEHGGRVGPMPTWSAEYVYPRWAVPVHAMKDDEPLL